MSNRSTILGLYEAMNGPITKDNPQRYAESTQTLYKDKSFTTGTPAAMSSERKDIFVEPDVYRKIVRGEHSYLVVLQDGFRIGEELHLIEMSEDRRTLYKTIVGIETYVDVPGLQAGYMILALG